MLLLSDVRKKLLLLWLSLSVVLLLFFLVQAQHGKYDGIEGTAWGWVFAQLLPALCILLAATLARRHTGKTVLRWVYRSIMALAALVLVFVLLTLLGISGGSAGLSLEEGFSRSWRYLLPLQALLCAVLGVLFFKKESIFLPNEALLRNHADQLLRQAEGPEALGRRRALELFVAAEMPALLDFLEETIRGGSANTTALNDVLLLKNNFTLLRKNTDMGLLSVEESRREYQRICVATISIIERI